MPRLLQQIICCRPAIAASLTLACVALATPARAEKEPLSQDELQKMATHIVVGKVNAIYSYNTKDPTWLTTHCVAEVAVEKVEKGEGLKPGASVYARFWHRRWISPLEQPPGSNGHDGMGNVGDKVRLYLIDKGYDGSGENTDGGFNVAYTNGCGVLQKAEGRKSVTALKASATKTGASKSGK